MPGSNIGIIFPTPVNNEDFLLIPVTPAELRIAYSDNYEELEVVGLGQIAFRKGDTLAEISWESFFPRDYDPTFCAVGGAFPLLKPREYVDFINSLRLLNKPLRLVIGGEASGGNLNLQVTIRQFEETHRGEELGDIYYKISFRKHRTVDIRKVDPKEVFGGSLGREDSQEPPGSIVTSAGDTLWDLAKLYLGDGERWREVYELNKDAIGPDPNMLPPGIQIRLPKKGESVPLTTWQAQSGQEGASEWTYETDNSGHILSMSNGKVRIPAD